MSDHIGALRDAEAPAGSGLSVSDACRKIRQVIEQVETVIVGKSHVVRQTLVGLIAGGHVLLEDIPGVGKTMLARAVAKSLGGTFKRIQFTPDLLPADITGSSVYDQSTREFVFRKGPVFANVVLADEINRATPKSQSSLLEGMEENQVTADGTTYPLEQPFFVIATANPIEFRGTFPLPETQMDRFLLRVAMGYPSHADEVEVLSRQTHEHPIENVRPVVTAAEVQAIRVAARDVHVDEDLKSYMVSLAEATRRDERTLLGASPRGSLGLFKASRALALLSGREFVSPDDIKRVAPAVLCHRVSVEPQFAIQGITPEHVVMDALTSVEVPIRAVAS